MPVLVGDCHLLYDLNIFVRNFDNTIHLWPVMRRIVMLDFELLAQGSDHSVVEICTIVSDDPFRDTVPQIRFFLMKRVTTFLVTEAKEAASTHFVK